MGTKQFGLGDYEQSTAKKRTKRERFLAEMEAVVPWGRVPLRGVKPEARLP
jgi:IS5 family transposase